MTRIPMNDVGTVGLVKDLDDFALPLDAWSGGQNIRFNNNNVVKFLGDKTVFNPPSVPPYFAMPVQTADTIFWLYAGLSKVYVIQGGTHTNITRIKTSPSFIPSPRELEISTTAPSIFPGVNITIPLINLTLTTSAPSVVVA